MKIQLAFDDYGERLVSKLQHWTGTKTYKDLFNNALTLLDWAIEQRAKGRIIASMDEGSQTYKELLMPSLQQAASIAEHERYVADWSANDAGQAATAVSAAPAVARQK